ncbi:unannotated protein [freshwater metagenome]|uniref:Unannotated protein n=1 Tax=freshwater metagenome TaxID=449393 RepID=A0A6J7FQ95_9ZZZZ
MVLVVEAVAGLLLDEVQHVAECRHDLATAQDILVVGWQVEQIAIEPEQLGQARHFIAELAVQLVTADTAEVVAAVLEERVAEERTRRLERGWLTRAGTLVDLHERLILGRREVTLLVPLVLEEVEVGNEPVDEAGGVLLVVAEGAQQGEDTQATLAGNAGTGGDELAGLVLDVELEPFTTVRVHGALDELVLAQVSQTEALTGLEDDAGTTYELAHHDTLGAVDDERALLGHHREVAHEDGLLFDLAGVAVHEPGAHEDGRRIGHVLFFALCNGELGRRAQVLVVWVEFQFELQCLREILDRRNIAEGFCKTLVQEPFEAFALDRNQIWKLQRLFEICKRITLTGGRTLSHYNSSLANGGRLGAR